MPPQQTSSFSVSIMLIFNSWSQFVLLDRTQLDAVWICWWNWIDSVTLELVQEIKHSCCGELTSRIIIFGTKSRKSVFGNEQLNAQTETKKSTKLGNLSGPLPKALMDIEWQISNVRISSSSRWQVGAADSVEYHDIILDICVNTIAWQLFLSSLDRSSNLHYNLDLASHRKHATTTYASNNDMHDTRFRICRSQLVLR